MIRPRDHNSSINESGDTGMVEVQERDSASKNTASEGKETRMNGKVRESRQRHEPSSMGEKVSEKQLEKHQPEMLRRKLY